MAGSGRIVKNSLALLIGYSYNAIVSIVAVALVARYLKLDKFGDYGFILAVCNIFMVITDMGINRIGIREMARDPSKANDIFSASFIIKSCYSIITVLLIVITMHILIDDIDLLRASYICAIAVVFFFYGDIFPSIFTAFEKMEYITLSMFVEQTSYLMGIMLCVHFDYGLDGIFTALLVSYLARMLYGFIVTYKHFLKPKLTYDYSLCRYLVVEGFPIGINRVLRKTSFRIDTIIIKMLRTASEVGIYYGAYRIILVLQFIPRNIVESLFPTFSRLAAESRESLGMIYEKSFRFLFVIVVPLVTFLFSFSHLFILIVLGDAFLEAVPALQIFSFVWGILFFNVLHNQLLNASNRQVFATKAVTVCLFINIVLDLVLVYYYGYLGAVIATLIAEVCLFATAYYFLASHVSSIPWGKVVLKPLLAVAPMVVILFFCETGSVVMVSLGGVLGVSVYVVCLFVLKTFEPDEIEFFRKSALKVWQKVYGLV